MGTIEELEKRVEELENELYFTRLIAKNVAINQKIQKWSYNFNILKPRLMNEKLLWLEENYWNYTPERYYRLDKYYFKYWWRTMFGTEYEIPLLGVWDRAEDIDFDILPQKFVIKRSLSGGSYEIKIVDKKKDNLEKIRWLVKGWMKDEFDFRPKARIIAEQMLEYEGENTIDYKFYVCNGKVSFCMCCVMNKNGGDRKYSYYDLNWKRYDNIKYHISEPVPKPEKLDEMIGLAEKVGAFFPFMRVDIYLCQGKIYIGELTDMPYNGAVPFGIEFDKKFGQLLKLPTKSDIDENIERLYSLFPELKEKPIFFKKYSGSWFVIQSDGISNKLPPPPKGIMQPMTISLQKYLSIDKLIESLNPNSKFTPFITGFLKRLEQDLNGVNKFQKWIDDVKEKNLKISILKSNDVAGQVLRKALEFNGIDIVFSSAKGNFDDLTIEETHQCFNADIIVCASIYSSKEKVKNGVKAINITSIL